MYVSSLVNLCGQAMYQILRGYYVIACGKVKDDIDATPHANHLALVFQKKNSLRQHEDGATSAAFVSCEL